MPTPSLSLNLSPQSSRISCFNANETTPTKPICYNSKKIESFYYFKQKTRTPTLSYSRISCFYVFETKKIQPFCCFKQKTSTHILNCVSKDLKFVEISKDNDDEEEGPPSQVESEVNSKPRRIALFVEPSPFSYVSGYKNRFQNFIKYLREMGDEVMVVTTHEGVPKEFHGAKLVGSRSFPLPWYQNVPLSLALSPRIINEVKKFKPDIIHASSPGIMVFGALLIAKLLCVPIVMSYHTHVPV